MTVPEDKLKKTEADYSEMQWGTTSPPETKLWFRWMKHRIRQFMILEAVFFVILILLLNNSYKIISQNETNFEWASFSGRPTYELPLALNCKYDSSGPQEQKCLVSYPDYLSDVYTIVFRFRKNHGNSKVTCAYLFRVFGKGMDPNEPIKASKETCSSLIWYRKNYPFIYNNILEKNCKVWYNNDCCDECPECCTECETQDLNYKTLLVSMAVFGTIFFFIHICYIVEKDKRKREGYIQ
ncbi:hypothetical protein CAEBREN_05410 [Caenorhabditis brenneri]|uniref:SUN domain-containing protein n=1 Tax=Caenorhabditis brenneri TaxID=135651 RepID=G0NFY2_CAEBE|nr:hypothetical protein CAEBREN_05410 [Caenorhabditis brenneri]